MTAKPSGDMDMDMMRPILFLEALCHLQAMLGHQVQVVLNEEGAFFGCGFEGKLKRVESMPSVMSGICVVLSGGAGFFLDPEGCQAVLVDGGEVVWLEFHRPGGPIVAIQAIEGPGKGVSSVASR